MKDEMPSNDNMHLGRIKKICLAIKILLVLYFLPGPLVMMFTRGDLKTYKFFNVSVATVSSIPLSIKLLCGLSIFMILFFIYTCFQLLNLFEKGIIFSTASAKLLIRIGYTLFISGLIELCTEVIFTGHLMLFPFFIAAMCSPWVIGGLFIIMLALILEEGRKIQEEQALTV